MYMYDTVSIQIGSLCMSVIEHELKRHRTLADNMSKRKKEGVTVVHM